MNADATNTLFTGHMNHNMRTNSFIKYSIRATAFVLLVLAHSVALAPVQAEENTSSGNTPSRQEQPYDSVEERRVMEAIKAAGNSQQAGEKAEIERRQKELKRLESEVDKKIDQLNQLRVKVEKLLQQKEAEEQKRVMDLAKMTADKAAVVLANLETPLAIAILRNMKTKSAAKILNNMEREKAAKLTTAFSTLDTR
jgi:flagellar motility protein MotE (MotC chaperone)